MNVCVLQFVGGEPRTVGPRQVSVALIRARLHMGLIDWEIIIYWGENEGGRRERKGVREGGLREK